MNRVIFLSIMFLVNLYAQDGDDLNSIGRFNNAKDFFINPAGFIYVTDINENQVYKLDTLGRLLKEIGGYGWDKSAFDYPVDVFATSLNVYVTDMNNHRVQWFDKDLNFISLLQNRNITEEKLQFGYPLAASVTSQGDLVILDSENNRILKFDMFGQFLLEFGGLDAGRFRIKKPLDFAVLNNTVYVLDDRGKRIVVFDQFGNGINIIETKLKSDNISVSDGMIWISDKTSVYYLDLNTYLFQKVLSSDNFNIQDVFRFNNQLYILTPKNIIIYPN